MAESPESQQHHDVACTRILFSNTLSSLQQQEQWLGWQASAGKAQDLPSSADG
ncbi:hypothetical protein [Escherichia coli]|uniref:hypothetical protein n=1 Tax=Escherichia coli TaxID=562 RepID=UPI003EEBC407